MKKQLHWLDKEIVKSSPREFAITGAVQYQTKEVGVIKV